MEQRRYPRGVCDFKALVTGDYYFVDKTGLICDLCGRMNQALFFTRPRGFGKTVNLSMIDHFFNVRYSQEEDIFEGLAVSKCERCAPYKHAYPVVRLNFGDISGESVELFHQTLDLVIANAAKEVLDSADSGILDEFDIGFLRKCADSTLNEIEKQMSIRNICYILRTIYRKNVIILVDEYDRYKRSISSAETYDSIEEDMMDFMEKTFKFNENYEFAVVTGVMPLGKTGMGSGFNNACVQSILDAEDDECFGFTEDEIVRLIDETGSPPEKIGEIREWYGGYRFGNADMYNPYSVMMYLDNGCEPEAYWNNMTGGGMPEDLVANMSSEPLSALIGLYESEGSSLETVLDTHIFYPEVFSPVAEPFVVYSYLAVTGYLKAARTGSQKGGYPLCRVSMVNKDASTAFERLIVRATEIEKRAADIMKCICEKDAAKLEEHLESILSGLRIDASWSRLFPASRRDRYLGIIMPYLTAPGQCARSEIPKGYENADIFIERREDRPTVAIVVRITIDPDMDLESLAQDALARIDRKRCAEDPDSADAICIGLGIRQKSVSAAFAKE